MSHTMPKLEAMPGSPSKLSEFMDSQRTSKRKEPELGALAPVAKRQNQLDAALVSVSKRQSQPDAALAPIAVQAILGPQGGDLYRDITTQWNKVVAGLRIQLSEWQSKVTSERAKNVMAAIKQELLTKYTRLPETPHPGAFRVILAALTENPESYAQRVSFSGAKGQLASFREDLQRFLDGFARLARNLIACLPSLPSEPSEIEVIEL